MVKNIQDFETLRTNIIFLYFTLTKLVEITKLGNELNYSKIVILKLYASTLFYHRMNPKIAIIGAGPYGLSFAYHMK
jgi:hypothetical protein